MSLFDTLSKQLFSTYCSYAYLILRVSNDFCCTVCSIFHTEANYHHCHNLLQSSNMPLSWFDNGWLLLQLKLIFEYSIRLRESETTRLPKRNYWCLSAFKNGSAFRICISIQNSSIFNGCGTISSLVCALHRFIFVSPLLDYW